MYGIDKHTRKNNDSMKDILLSPNKNLHKITGFHGVLATLWRVILKDRDIRPEKFSRLLDYCIRTQSDRLFPRADRSSLKGNIMKEMAKPKLTWRSIMKGILIMRIRRFKITFSAEYCDQPGVFIDHVVSVDLSPFYNPDNVFDRIYEDDRVETNDEMITRLSEQISSIVRAHEAVPETKQSEEQQKDNPHE